MKGGVVCCFYILQEKEGPPEETKASKLVQILNNPAIYLGDM